MAKRGRRPRGSGTKSAAIQQVFEKLGLKAKNREVIAEVKALGFDVAGSQISNLRKKLLSEKSGAKKNGRGHGGGKSVDVAALMEAKRFVRVAGGIAAARAALETLSRLRD